MRADDYEQIINYDWPQDEGYVLPSVQTNVSKVSEDVLPGGKLIRFWRAMRII